MPELWHVRKVTLEEVFKIKKNCGMLQLEDKVDYLVYFYEHQPREVLILDSNN
jgi:hypothetical protein